MRERDTIKKIRWRHRYALRVYMYEKYENMILQVAPCGRGGSLCARFCKGNYSYHYVVPQCSEAHNFSLKSITGVVHGQPGLSWCFRRQGTEAYTPYGALCRGENATSIDLWDCYSRMKKQNPLHRGLYADQLERWFRVFDRSQVCTNNG